MEENPECLVQVAINSECQNKSVIVPAMWFVVTKVQVWPDVLDSFVLLPLEGLKKIKII